MKRPQRLLFGLAMALITHTAQSSPFLVCDPYPPDKAQPDTFLVVVGTAAPVASPAAKNPDGSVALKYDLANIGAGPKTIRVRAKNAWGESGDSLPFTFTAGAPALVGGLRLVAGESGSAQ
ncbi:MAG: hypothetical protein WBQ05_01660 [Candidatus Competibacter denitrificans]